MLKSRAQGTGRKLLPKGEGENFSCVTIKFTLFTGDIKMW